MTFPAVVVVAAVVVVVVVVGVVVVQPMGDQLLLAGITHWVERLAKSVTVIYACLRQQSTLKIQQRVYLHFHKTLFKLFGTSGMFSRSRIF